MCGAGRRTDSNDLAQKHLAEALMNHVTLRQHFNATGEADPPTHAHNHLAFQTAAEGEDTRRLGEFRYCDGGTAVGAYFLQTVRDGGAADVNRVANGKFR